MAGGKDAINNAGNSEGARKGWETRKGGGGGADGNLTYPGKSFMQGAKIERGQTYVEAVPTFWSDTQEPTADDVKAFEDEFRAYAAKNYPKHTDIKVNVSSHNPHGYGIPKWSMYARASDAEALAKMKASSTFKHFSSRAAGKFSVPSRPTVRGSL